MTTSKHIFVVSLAALVIAGATAAVAPSPAAAQTAKKLKCNGCIKSKQLRNNGIKGADIKSGAIDSAKVKDGSLTGADIQDGSITLDDLAAGTVPAAIFQSTVVVNADPLDPAGNCTALRAALAGITDNSAARPYLIKLEPGVYNCGGNSTGATNNNNLDMKPFVDIEGSGQGVTTILGDTNDDSEAVLGMAGNAELRHLTVENVNATENGHALRVPDPVRGRVSHVTLVGGPSMNGGNEAIDCESNTSNPGIVVSSSIVRATDDEAGFSCDAVYVSTQLDSIGAADGGTPTCIAAYTGDFEPLMNDCSLFPPPPPPP